MSWYRLHRPKQVSELHLGDVKRTLLQFMAQGKIPQVLLFAGPKGTGKTSSARILGALLNDPANEEVVEHQFFGKDKPKKVEYVEPDPQNEFNQKIFAGQSFVVQEMDAASNRGIDDVRSLKERVMLPPQQGKITVYILDEAHMLTTEAFNALLKLLEEPPQHAVFILATTELHKIPETIASRSSSLQFRKGTIAELSEAMTAVLKTEKVEFDPMALEAIAIQADGSFRDAIKLLEMVASAGNVSLESVESSLQGSVKQQLSALLGAVVAKNDQEIASIFESLRVANTSESFFYKSLLNTIHYAILQSLGIGEGEPILAKPVALFLLRELSVVPQTPTPIPFLHLELKLLELVDRAKQKSGGGASSGTPQTAVNPVKKNETLEKISQTEAITVEVDDFVPPLPTPETQSQMSGDSQQLIEKWSELLAAVKEKNVTLEALLRSAKPVDGENGIAKVAVYYKFHKEQLEHPKFSAVIEECISPLAGGPIKLVYVLSDLPVEAELIDKVDDHLAALAEEALI